MHGLVIPSLVVTDMANVLLLLAGYLLGIGSVVIFGALMVLHRPKYEDPTLRRRRYRDRPVPEVKMEVQTPEERPISMYGITGLEED